MKNLEKWQALLSADTRPVPVRAVVSSEAWLQITSLYECPVFDYNVDGELRMVSGLAVERCPLLDGVAHYALISANGEIMHVELIDGESE